MSPAVRPLTTALRALAAGGSTRSLVLGTAYLKQHSGSRIGRILSVIAATLATGLAAATLAQQGEPPTRVVPPPSPNAAPAVSFVDVTAQAGLSAFRHVSGSPEKDYIPEATGSGVGVSDFDGDGFVDIYLVNGGTLDPDRSQLPAAPPAALFRNNGDGTFRDVAATAGVANERWGQGVCVGDVDNDGQEDLYVTNFGRNRLYHAAGGGRFVDVAETAGVAVESWSTGCAFGDYDGDGWLDLFVAGYVTLDLANLPPSPTRRTAQRTEASAPPAQGGGMGAAYSAGAAFCTYRGAAVMCGPRGLRGAADHLFRNNRDGTFTETSRQAGVADEKGRYGLGVAWFDLDDDGRLDLLVANDSGPNYVYRNRGDGRFDDVSYPSGAALDGNGREQAHMGVAIGDYDNDGRNDIHITNFADDFNVLYHNHDGATFTDVSFRMGVATASIPFLGWGTDFLDYDNDGWLDLLVVNGHVYPSADVMPWNTSYAQRALLFRNLAGRRFEEIGAAAGPGLTTPRVSRGSAVGDFDNDGGLDVVINNLDGAPTVARNVGGGSAGHWLKVRLLGDPGQRCPRDGIGSVVFVTAGGLRRRGEVASGRGQISQSDLRVHIGLGRETTVSKVEVRWAGGGTVTYAVDRVDAIVTIDQKTGRVTYDR
ncbi:MAG: CRTAC1 family protein [Vicinamibacteria bacterium]|nr:CRTAC1 family protein [Vicinamibacteria bacterium]